MYTAKNLQFEIGDLISTHLYGDLTVLEKKTRVNAKLNSYIVRNIDNKSLYRHWPHTGVFEPIGFDSYQAA